MKKIKKDITMGEIVIYQASRGKTSVEVQLKKDTVWLNLNQIALLFETDKSGVSRHISNIYQIGELKQSPTVAKIATVQIEGKRRIKRIIEYYNLDVVLSVGYRVNSKRAAQFRVWATRILKDHLIKGYTINEKRLLETQKKFKELQVAINFMQEKSKKELLAGQEGEILDLLSSYAKTFTLLAEYDKKKFRSIKGKTTKYILKNKKCVAAISELKNTLVSKGEASNLFGTERQNIFEGIIENIYQTFGKKELYPTLEDKASHLLYLIIKDHPFVDGNKRSAAFLFIYFLTKTDFLYRSSGERKINDNALTALALLIAESNPKEKDIMIKIIKSLISG